MKKYYKSRDEVEEQYKWDLTEYFKNEEEFDKCFLKAQRNIKQFTKYIGCTKRPDDLYSFLVLQTDTIGMVEDLFVYSYLINDQVLGVTESMERKNRVELLELELDTALSFFAPELLKLSKKNYIDLFQKNPKLLEFKAGLDKIYRGKEHILKEEEEVIVSSLVNAMNHYDDISSCMINQLHNYGTIHIDGDDVIIASTNYRHLMHNREDDIRYKVRNQFQSRLAQYADANAMLLSSYVSMNDTIAKIRHFDSSWDAHVFSLNMPSDVFHTLVDTVEKHLDSFQRYYQLKKKVLGLKELTGYDTLLELSNNHHTYRIEEAQKITLKAVEPLGEEYQSKFKKIFTDHMIDYCQYKGKCSGAYSFSTSNHNSRILMSYNRELESISTIIHEGGHNVHHQFVKENNPSHYRATSPITAEVASLTNECLLSHFFLQHGRDKEEKLSGISNIMEVIISNLYGAVREGKMEEEMYETVHNGGMLTKDYLNDLSYNSLIKYYGDSVAPDEGFKNGWITRGHYYMNFYLYSYAICVSVACSVASKIMNGDKDMLSKYIAFLKVGSDVWPMDAFKVLGIDLEDKSVYEDAIKYFDSLIDTYETINNE